MDENLKKLMDNETFMNGLASVESADDLAKVLSENNVELDGVTVEEAFAQIQEQEDLSEDDLEKVSGGILFTTALLATGAFVVGGGTLCFLAGAARGYYDRYKKSRRK